MVIVKDDCVFDNGQLTTWNALLSDGTKAVKKYTYDLQGNPPKIAVNLAGAGHSGGQYRPLDN